MSRFHASGLQNFIDEGDREPPACFVGREDLVQLAVSTVEKLRGGKTRGNTILVQGAPGAGKTALLEHIKDHLGKGVDTAYVSAPLLARPEVALFEMLEQIEPDKAAEAVRAHQTTMSGGVSVMGASGTRSTTSISTPADIKTVRQLIGLRANPNQPLVLFMDEAQNTNGDLSDGRSSILQELHEGKCGPAMLIAGGLSDSESRLAKLGVSRDSDDNFTTLQPLADHEVVAALLAFLSDERFGIHSDNDPARLRAIKEMAVEEAMGWPQHLTNTLRSLAEELVQTDGDLSEVNVEAVRDKSRTRRERYYSKRTKGIPTPLLLAVIGAVPKNGGADPYSIHESIQGAYQKSPLLQKMLSEDQAYETLVQRGVLQDGGAGNMVVPIPSMHDYIARRSEPPPSEQPPQTR